MVAVPLLVALATLQADHLLILVLMPLVPHTVDPILQRGHVVGQERKPSMPTRLTLLTVYCQIVTRLVALLGGRVELAIQAAVVIWVLSGSGAPAVDYPPIHALMYGRFL